MVFLLLLQLNVLFVLAFFPLYTLYVLTGLKLCSSSLCIISRRWSLLHYVNYHKFVMIHKCHIFLHYLFYLSHYVLSTPKLSLKLKNLSCTMLDRCMELSKYLLNQWMNSPASPSLFLLFFFQVMILTLHLFSYHSPIASLTNSCLHLLISVTIFWSYT